MCSCRIDALDMARYPNTTDKPSLCHCTKEEEEGMIVTAKENEFTPCVRKVYGKVGIVIDTDFCN